MTSEGRRDGPLLGSTCRRNGAHCCGRYRRNEALVVFYASRPVHGIGGIPTATQGPALSFCDVGTATRLGGEVLGTITVGQPCWRKNVSGMVMGETSFPGSFIPRPRAWEQSWYRRLARFSNFPTSFPGHYCVPLEKSQETSFNIFYFSCHSLFPLHFKNSLSLTFPSRIRR